MSSSEAAIENHDLVFAGNMNQKCKVCGEPAAGFHFGAFTCEGCKSFFGRTYNNLSSLNECKNGGRCSINKKTRTSCKSCRLRKCLMVGMSKSGSRYGRRSNWFKIHFLMQGRNADEMASLPTGSSLTPPANALDCWDRTTPSLEHSKDIHKELFGLTSQIIGTDFNSTVAANIQVTDLIMNQKSSSDETSGAGNGQDFSLRFQVKEPKSCNPSSSESITPDIQKDLGDNSFNSNYFNKNLYSKDFLTLYNLPGVSHRFPSLLSPPNFTQRFLYPYYPQLLSLYTGTQYMDNILNDAMRATNKADGKNRLSQSSEGSDDSDQDCNLDIQPPLKIIKRCPPSSPSLIPINGTVGVNASLKNSSDAPFPSVVPKVSPINALAGQTSPIDLSVRSKSPTLSAEGPKSSFKIKEEEVEALDRNDNYKVSFVIDDLPPKVGPLKTEQQQIPLDLSGFKT